MNNRFFILVFIVVVFILGGLLYIYNPSPIEYKNPNQKEPVACTMEAKLCPDGSYVGRTGPNCEFTPCPTTSDITGSSTKVDNIPGTCTAEVSICPDGSFVGRVAPNCEFAQCPSIQLQ